MSYTQNDAARDACHSLKGQLDAYDLETVTLSTAITLLEDVYETVASACDDYDENGYRE